MSVGILACGAPPAGLEGTHGNYASMTARLIGPAPHTTVYDAVAGALPEPQAHTAYILTGSPAGVYDPLPWIDPLLQFLRAARGRAKIVGICFGHQAMAQAWGGQVVKSGKGWGVGLHRYDVLYRAPWMDEATTIAAAASHQDQVVAAPQGARVTLASAFTPYAGLDYGDAISFQFHPEFTPAFSTALIESREDNYGALTGPALRSLQAPDDCARVGQWIGRFINAAPCAWPATPA